MIAAGGQEKRQGSQWALAARLGAADHDSAGLRGTVPAVPFAPKAWSLCHTTYIFVTTAFRQSGSNVSSCGEKWYRVEIFQQMVVSWESDAFSKFAPGHRVASGGWGLGPLARATEQRSKSEQIMGAEWQTCRGQEWDRQKRDCSDLSPWVIYFVQLVQIGQKRWPGVLVWSRDGFKGHFFPSPRRRLLNIQVKRASRQSCVRN